MSNKTGTPGSYSGTQRPYVRPYVRPMAGWWRKNPFFVWYMIREVTALGVAAYAIELAAGVVCLARGESAWNSWLAVKQHPLMIVLNLVLLVCMVLHAHSWFDIMPKTMPMMIINGKRLEGAVITRSGWAAVVVVTVAFLAIACWG